MTESLPILAVDGGGSFCRFRLDTADGPLRHEGPAANVFTDFDAALGVLWDGLSALSAEGRLSLAEVPACFALAGVIDDGVAQRVARALPLKDVQVVEDWRAAVHGALGEADGVVIGIGTGSFLAKRQGGAIRALGGHGLMLGDEASGAWLGRGVLAHALHAAEGLEDETPLTRTALAGQGGVTETVAFARSAVPADYAELAPMVIDAARDGDPAGTALMRAGAAYIAQAFEALDAPPDGPVCLLGGVAPAYRDWLPEALVARLTEPAGTALDGARAIAAGRGA